MKFVFALTAILIMARNASATESIALYAQGCHTYWENGQPKYECAAEEKVNIELKVTGPSSQQGNWANTVRMGGTSFNVSIEIQKLTLPNGSVISTITGGIKQTDNTPLATVSSNLSKDMSVSLASMVPIGEKKSAPHFFFGTPLSFNQLGNILKMQNVLAEMR